MTRGNASIALSTLYNVCPESSTLFFLLQYAPTSITIVCAIGTKRASLLTQASNNRMRCEIAGFLCDLLAQYGRARKKVDNSVVGSALDHIGLCQPTRFATYS